MTMTMKQIEEIIKNSKPWYACPATPDQIIDDGSGKFTPTPHDSKAWYMAPTIAYIKEHGYGEITINEIVPCRDAGFRIHSFYRNENDEIQTHYAATPEFVESHHRSGGLWEYNS